jgi:cutinase
VPRHIFGHGWILVRFSPIIHSILSSDTDFSRSQGGQLVHNAADMLSAQDAAFVNSAVIFGDPNNGKPVGKVAAGDTMVVCHTGDLICAGTSIILAPHLTYGVDGAAAATFVVGNMKAPAAAGAASAATAKAATAKAAAAKGAKKATRAIKFVS